MGELIVVTGPPGAGKSTVARLLSAMFEPSACVPGDEFFGFIDQGFRDPWTQEADRQNDVVLGAAAAAAGRLAAGGYTVVYDGILRPAAVNGFVRAAAADRLHYVLLLPSEQLCLERVASRRGHGFTDLDAARHMYAEFAGTGIGERHVVTSCAEPEAVAALARRLIVDGQCGWRD